MTPEFKQSTVNLKSDNPTEPIKISKLLTIINKHPYYKEIVEALKIDSLKEEFIGIENIKSAFNYVKNANEEFEKINAVAEAKNIDVVAISLDSKPTIEFHFDQCRADDELKENLKAEAIYESKNTFFEDYKMSKYANHLYDNGFSALVDQNIQYFKKLASEEKEHNKSRSYRILKKEDKYYLRGITSERYNEYGIDFTFFVTMLLLHQKMKHNKGSNYSIVNISLSESKLDMIIKDNNNLKIKNFGNVSLAIKVSTNELGRGSLNVVSTIRVEGEKDATLVYLFPKGKNQIQNKHIINHTTNLVNVFSKLEDLEKLFDVSDDFVKDIQDIKGINTPDELRNKIQMKIIHPNSTFKDLAQLKDIFKSKIDNEINNFSKLLEMCKKAEELDIDYDIKDKLRYIISDIILYGTTK